MDKLPRILEIVGSAEIVPKPQGNGRKQQPAAPATAIVQLTVTAGIGEVTHRKEKREGSPGMGSTLMPHALSLIHI